jgi:hypothetical protein
MFSSGHAHACVELECSFSINFLHLDILALTKGAPYF